jgi:hypothetical protein
VNTGVRVRVTLTVEVGRGVEEEEREFRDTLGSVEGDKDPLSVGLTELLPDSKEDPVLLGEGEVEPLKVGLPEVDRVSELEAEADTLGVYVSVKVRVWVGLGDGEAEALGEEDWVARQGDCVGWPPY